MLVRRYFPRSVISRIGPGDQTIKFVTVRTVSKESLFIEQSLDSTTEANLVGIALRTHRPAHFAVPAAAKQHYADTS